MKSLDKQSAIDRLVHYAHKARFRKLLCFLGFHHILLEMVECDPGEADQKIGMNYFKATKDGRCMYCDYTRRAKKKI